MVKAIIERDTRDYLRLIMDMSVALTAGANDVRNYLTTMPPPKPKKLGGPLPGGFYSEKQSRYVRAAIADGRIEVPYLRTQDLARSWSITSVDMVGDSLKVEVYSDPSRAPYGRIVQDETVRPEMHSDWPSVEGAARDMAGKVEERLRAVGKDYGLQ